MELTASAPSTASKAAGCPSSRGCIHTPAPVIGKRSTGASAARGSVRSATDCFPETSALVHAEITGWIWGHHAGRIAGESRGVEIGTQILAVGAGVLVRAVAIELIRAAHVHAAAVAAEADRPKAAREEVAGRVGGGRLADQSVLLEGPVAEAGVQRGGSETGARTVEAVDRRSGKVIGEDEVGDLDGTRRACRVAHHDVRGGAARCGIEDRVVVDDDVV